MVAVFTLIEDGTSVHPCVQIAENKNRKCLEADAAQLQPGEKNDFISEGEEASLPAVVLSTSDDLPTTKSPIVGSWSYQSPALDRVELEDSALLLLSQRRSRRHWQWQIKTTWWMMRLNGRVPRRIGGDDDDDDDEHRALCWWKWKKETLVSLDKEKSALMRRMLIQ